MKIYEFYACNSFGTIRDRQTYDQLAETGSSRPFGWNAEYDADADIWHVTEPSGGYRLYVRVEGVAL